MDDVVFPLTGLSCINAVLTAGKAYAIRVDGESEGRGYVVLSWTTVPTPINDDVASPIALTTASGNLLISTVNASINPGVEQFTDYTGPTLW